MLQGVCMCGVDIEESLVSCAYPVPLCPRHLWQRSSLPPARRGSEQTLPSCSFWPSEELPFFHQPQEKGNSKLGKSRNLSKTEFLSED